MGVDTKEETILEVGELRDIRYEEVGKFSQSISRDAYKRAIRITKEIIKDNESLESGNTDRTSNGTIKRNLEQIYNIIFFTGNRGSGKTSTMLSYMEYLKDYYRNMERTSAKVDEYRFGDKPYMFTGIEYIDASSLDEKEDILGSVLSKMLKKWQDEEERSSSDHGIVRNSDYAYNKRQMSMLFSRVYELLKNLRSSDDPTKDDSDAFMETVQNLSLTRNLQEAFKELVEKYLSIMTYPGATTLIKSTNHFLVISIDDLDMNIESGFRLLEEIRRYFMIPHIIVLLSANYDQLEKICLNYYMTKFDKIRGEYNTNQYVSSLAREYLEKMVPARRQIVMESGRKWRFFNQKQILIQYKDPSTGSEKKLEGTLEEIVKKKMYEMLGAQFIQGEKCLAYLTPDTVRELCAWINHTGKHDKEESVRGEEEYRWFENEEFPVLCRKYLEPQDRDVFEVLESLDPEAQVSYVTEYLRKEYKIEKDCSLLEALAMLRKEGLREQSFSSLLNIYFTVKLAKLREYMKVNDKNEAKKNKAALLVYFKDGIWGQWEKRMVGPFQKNIAGVADGTLCELSYYSFEKIGESLDIATKFPSELVVKTDQETGNAKKGMEIKAVNDILQDNAVVSRMKNYQCLLLFYDFYESDETANIWRMNSNEFKLDREHKGKFCLSNPIINLMKKECLARKFLKEFGNMMYEQKMKEDTGDKRRNKSNQPKYSSKEKFQDTIDKKFSIFSEDEEVIPLDNLDFLITLGEKIQSSMGNSITAEKDITDRIKEYYETVEKSLKEIDVNLADKFSAQEFIQKIKDPNNKELKEMLTFAITASTKPRTLVANGMEWGNS